MPDYRLGQLKGQWVVTWYDGTGTRRRIRLFEASEGTRTRRQAEDRLADFVRAQTAGAVPTVASLWEAYRQDKTGRRVADKMRSEWKLMAPFWGHLRPEDITTEKCRQWVALRRQGGTKDGTIWTELGHLRTVFKWAYEERLIDRAPKVERPAKPDPRDNFLTRAEAERLINACDAPHIALAVQLLLGSAARVGAVLELLWRQVDLDRGQIRLADTGMVHRKGRSTVPIGASLRAALAAARDAATCDYVIEYKGGPVKSITTGFRAAARRAGLKVTPHDLRRTAARLMVEAGMSMDEVAQFLGHSDNRITSRVYGKYSVDYLRKGAEVLDFSGNFPRKVIK